MTTEELQKLAIEHGEWLDDNRLAFSLDRLAHLAAAIRQQAFRELHPFAAGPAEHAAIDAAPAGLVDSLADRPVAARLGNDELTEAMGMVEIGPRLLAQGRGVERAVWLKNRLRVPT